MKPKIKAILFDMDGVLINAREWHFDALNRALSFFGMEITFNDHLRNFDGLPTKKKLKLLSLHKGLPVELHEFINELKQKFTHEEITLKCKPFFHHEYALGRLRQEGYKLAVCSNSIKDTMKLMLSKANIINYFDILLSNNDVKKSKPDPEMYLKCMNDLGVLPSESIILEDNQNGIKAAKSSGANLMVVENIDDVNYFKIKELIKIVEGA